MIIFVLHIINLLLLFAVKCSTMVLQQHNIQSSNYIPQQSSIPHSLNKNASADKTAPKLPHCANIALYTIFNVIINSTIIRYTLGGIISGNIIKTPSKVSRGIKRSCDEPISSPFSATICGGCHISLPSAQLTNNTCINQPSNAIVCASRNTKSKSSLHDIAQLRNCTNSDVSSITSTKCIPITPVYHFINIRSIDNIIDSLYLNINFIYSKDIINKKRMNNNSNYMTNHITSTMYSYININYSTIRINYSTINFIYAIINRNSSPFSFPHKFISIYSMYYTLPIFSLLPPFYATVNYFCSCRAHFYYLWHSNSNANYDQRNTTNNNNNFAFILILKIVLFFVISFLNTFYYCLFHIPYIIFKHYVLNIVFTFYFTYLQFISLNNIFKFITCIFNINHTSLNLYCRCCSTESFHLKTFSGFTFYFNSNTDKCQIGTNITIEGKIQAKFSRSIKFNIYKSNSRFISS